MNIRPYRAEDAAALSKLYARSVEAIGGRHYSADQIRAWAALAPSPRRLNELMRDGRTRLVAADLNDQPVAFGDLELDGHIDLLYCAPEAWGSGVASALYDALEGAAQASGVRRLHAEASEAARGFFMRKGFVVTARRELDLSGVAIHNYAVEKVLAGEVAGD